MTIFLLFGIVLFFGLLLIYTFKVIALSGLVYLILIPISFLHYQKIKKQKNTGVLLEMKMMILKTYYKYKKFCKK